MPVSFVSSSPRSGPVLGIETSCDETAAAVVARGSDGAPTILSNVVLSQIEEHAAFGGVVPEIAARAHTEALDGVVRAAMAEAGLGFADLAAVAATSGPGLVGGLVVGATTGKAIAAARSLPFLAINHLEGHALTPRLTDRLEYPYLLLLVSGGHSQILLVHGLGEYERWGTTIDDAAGEAFDKTAKLLSLPSPGGPSVERLAVGGNPKRFDLPRPMRHDPGLDFSFSGLKTAVRVRAEKAAPLDQEAISDLCAGFQAAVAELVGSRMARALARFAERFPEGPTPVIAIAGGVAANGAIRAELQARAHAAGAHLVAPPLELCSDNAAMIAYAGLERLEAGLVSEFSAPVRPRWPLDERSASVVGHGRRGAKV